FMLDDTPVAVNEYYVRRPEMMLGHLALTGTMYRGKEPTLAGELTAEQLDLAIAVLPSGIYTPRGKEKAVQQVEISAGQEELTGVKDGGYAYIDGRIVVRQGNRFEATTLTMTETWRVR